MVDYKHPERPAERLSNAERGSAVAALRRHAADGRITPEEFDERSRIVASAKTWHDLSAPFADLPGLPAATHDYLPPDRATRVAAPARPPAGSAPTDRPQAHSRPPAAAPGGPGPDRRGPESSHPFDTPGATPPDPPRPAASARPSAQAYGRAGRRHGGRVHPLGGRIGATIMAATPIAAVVLFFLTGVVAGYGLAWLWFLAIPLMGAIIYAPWYEEE